MTRRKLTLDLRSFYNGVFHKEHSYTSLVLQFVTITLESRVRGYVHFIASVAIRAICLSGHAEIDGDENGGYQLENL